MQAPAHYRRFVRGLKLFEGFTNGEIDVLMGVLRPERLQAEDPVFVQGRLGNACFVVVRGSIRVTLGLGANAQEVATLGQGTLFGQVALIDGGCRSANCIALIGAIAANSVASLASIGAEACANLRPSVATSCNFFPTRSHKIPLIAYRVLSLAAA